MALSGLPALRGELGQFIDNGWPTGAPKAPDEPFPVDLEGSGVHVGFFWPESTGSVLVGGIGRVGDFQEPGGRRRALDLCQTHPGVGQAPVGGVEIDHTNRLHAKPIRWALTNRMHFA